MKWTPEDWDALESRLTKRPDQVSFSALVLAGLAGLGAIGLGVGAAWCVLKWIGGWK